jgi:hypothetical protein
MVHDHKAEIGLLTSPEIFVEPAGLFVPEPLARRGRNRVVDEIAVENREVPDPQLNE